MKNIRNGRLYPSSGCGVVTNFMNYLKEQKLDSGIVIDYEKIKK
jgi:hypothetical protein